MNLKDANKYRNRVHKRLPKFSQLLGNPITPTRVYLDYLSTCAIRLHNVGNRVTQREQLNYPR